VNNYSTTFIIMSGFTSGSYNSRFQRSTSSPGTPGNCSVDISESWEVNRHTVPWPAAYELSQSVSQCMADGHRNGNQQCTIGHCGSKMTLPSLYFTPTGVISCHKLVNIKSRKNTDKVVLYRGDRYWTVTPLPLVDQVTVKTVLPCQVKSHSVLLHVNL